MLTRCTFNGQQCCPQYVIDEFDNAMRLAFNNGTIPFTRSFADAQKAVDEMRKDATSMHYVYINLCKNYMHLKYGSYNKVPACILST